MELPEEAAHALIESYARLLARAGEEIGERPLVLPTAEFFPDEFHGDEASLRRLLKRMRRHAGLFDVPIRGRVLAAEEDSAPGSSCSSGACAAPVAEETRALRVVEDGDGWRIQAPAAELKHPVVLTANLARALGLVFLLETLGPGESLAAPVEVNIEIAAVALGFGELLLEASHIYQKSCGGPSIGQVTALTHPELALLSALFVAMHDYSPRKLKKHLPVTQAETFDKMVDLVHLNKKLVRRMREAPADIAAGDFTLKAVGKKNSREEDEPSLAELEAAFRAAPPKRTPKKADPLDDELAALVDEALAVTRAE